ncbi:MAG: hypothetical protein DDT37_02017 [Firmicutes bacterium]|nr:hypothetical protein [candidate division NPL-UPA2 bacterium]
MRAGRELVWYYGRYDEPALRAFIEDFKPDVIFSARMASIKLLRLEQLVRTIAGVPLVAFTGDAEYTNRLISYSPLFWLRRWFLRRAFRGMMPHYSLYFTSSEVQNKEYATEFGDKFSLLRKCATPISEFASHSPQYPIQIVYAGKLYCNRWKTLALLARVLRGVNAGESLVELSVYTRDVVPLHINKQLHDGIGACLRGAVSASELDSIYSRADIALHVEAFDTRNRLATRLSFSTKVVDCLASGCAVMVIAWEEHAGLVYLRKADAAFWATSEVEMQQLIQRIVKNPAIIHDYARKAMQCVRSNHDRDSIQQGLVQELARVTGKTQHLEN